MRKFSVVMLIFSLLAGTAGFLLRRYELRNAFEPDTGLVIRGSVPSVLTALITVIYFLLLILVAIYVAFRYKPGEGFVGSFASGSKGYLTTVIITSAVWIAGTVIHMLSLRQHGLFHTADIYFSTLSVLAAVCSVISAVELRQSLQQKSTYVLSLVPIIFLCFWLIFFYRQNASNPVMQSYVYQCLAVIACIMSFYYTSGFLFSKPSPAKASIAYGMTVFLCSTSLADYPGPGISLIYAAMLALSAAQLFLLLRNISYKG